MDSKKLSLLVVVFIVLAGLAYVVKKPSTQPTEGMQAGDKLLAPFDANAVSQIEVSGPDGSLNLKRQDGTWVVSSLFGYPANFETLAQQVRGLLELEAGQVIRNGSQYLDEFGLGENSRQLTLKDDTGNTLAQLTIGKEREPANASPFAGFARAYYVMNPEGDVALVEGDLGNLPDSPEGWITTDVVNLSSADITAITVSSNQTAYTLGIGSGNNYSLDGLNKNQEVDSSKAGRLSRALQFLNFAQVVDPSRDDASLGLDQPVTYTAESTEGIRYTVQLGTAQSDGVPLRIAATYDAPATPSREQAVDASENEEQVEEKYQELLTAHKANVDAAQEKLNALKPHVGWTYLIEPYSAEALMIPRAQLIKEKTAEEN